jgi:hypothetical protein
MVGPLKHAHILAQLLGGVAVVAGVVVGAPGGDKQQQQEGDEEGMGQYTAICQLTQKWASKAA